MQERRKLCNLVSLQALKVNTAVSIAREAAFRFAPSPNGLLHLGHAYSAIQTYEMAQKYAGRLYLRIEDIDKARSQECFRTAIIRDLHWLGIKWQEPVLYQSDNFELYESAINDLCELGLLYPCFASRSEIKQALKQSGAIKQDPDGAPLYPALYKDYPKSRAEERIKTGEPFALRLHMNKAIERAKQLESEIGTDLTYQAVNKEGKITSTLLRAERWGDVVIKRKDIPTSYHLSVVIDDHNLGITHICRGKDLEAATDIHRILQINLGLSEPIYHHHDLVLYNQGKLSKSKGHPSLFELREKGINPRKIYESALLGLSHDPSLGPAALSKYLP